MQSWSSAARIASLVLACALAAGSGRAPVAKAPDKVVPPAAVQRKLGVTGAGKGLARITSEPVAEANPAISPDGKTLLFDVRVFAADASLSAMTIVGVDPNQAAGRTLYTSDRSFAMEPAWLPDGKAIFYPTTAPGNWSLVKTLSTAPNAAITIIASGEIAPNVSRPTLAPDGQRVAFATTVQGVSTIAVVGVDGSRLTFLGEGYLPAWSPDGTRLAFVRPVSGVFQIFLVDPNTGTNVVQVTTGDAQNSYPAWSPDGRFIAFTTNRGAKTADEFNIYLVKPDGTSITQLTDGSAKSTQPAWGRDGWIYFASDVMGNFDIWRLQPEGDFAAQ